MFIVGLIFLLVSTTIADDILFEVPVGSKCTLKDINEVGSCIKLNSCQYAKNLLKQKKSPQYCGFSGRFALVCCPLPASIIEKPGEMSRKMCDNYTYVEHIPRGIDQGQRALSKEFPHMAAVGYGNDKNNIVWLCGGSLISHYFILSAAHCAESSEFGPAKWIRLGDLDIKNTTEDANPLDTEIVKIYTYPNYKSSSHYHDIALFKLESYVYFGEYFSPACLQIQKEILPKVLVATGWGRLGFAGDTSSHLMKVELNIVDHKTCKKRYDNLTDRWKLQNGILDEYQICAGNAEGGDACQGDSGGPLHYFVETMQRMSSQVMLDGSIYHVPEDGFYLSHFVVAGITSFRKGCGGEDSAGVYTRVSNYVKWIENIVWPEPSV